MKHPETDDMTTPMTKLYDKDRRPWDLEPHYCRHTSAMTEEGLHSKSDIAAELAFRDKQIDRLRNALVAARGVIREMAAGDPWSGYGDSPEQRITAALDATEGTK